MVPRLWQQRLRTWAHARVVDRRLSRLNANALQRGQRLEPWPAQIKKSFLVPYMPLASTSFAKAGF